MKSKKVFSVLLTISIIFGCSAFSFAAEDVDAKYTYRGTIEAGRTTVWESDNALDSVYDLYVSYTFTAEADGYYSLTYGTPHTSIYAEIVGAENFKEAVYDYYLIQRLYYLEKGEYELTVDVYNSFTEVYIYTDYYGETITDISFDYDQVEDCDFWFYKDLADNETYFASYADATITFTGGKTYSFSGGITEGTIDEEFKEGSNKITIDFLGNRISSSATVYDISHYIKDIEISNIENYFDDCKMYCTDADFVYPYGETLTVTFSDSSTESFDYDNSNPIHIKLSNGQYYKIYVFGFYNPFSNKRCSFEIYVENNFMKEYRFNGTKASLPENLNVIKYELQNCFDNISYNLKQMFKNLTNEDYYYYLSEATIAASEIAYIFYCIAAYII